MLLSVFQRLWPTGDSLPLLESSFLSRGSGWVETTAWAGCGARVVAARRPRLVQQRSLRNWGHNEYFQIFPPTSH